MQNRTHTRWHGSLRPVPLCRLLLAVFCLFAGQSALGLEYQQSDSVILGVRQDQANFELVVNLGSVTRFMEAEPGTVIELPELNPETLSFAFAGFGGLRWSVAASIVGVEPEVRPRNTLWTTRPRTSVNEPTTPWVRQRALSQGGTAAAISSIGANAASYSDQQPTNPVSNSDTAVVIAAGDLLSYSSQVGPSGNYRGYFQGVVENLTPQDFVSVQGISRSDFYELEPSTTTEPGKLLGHFDLRWDGRLTYTAGSTVTPEVPVIESIVPVPGGYEIRFLSSPGVTYSLRTTDADGLSTPAMTWETLPQTVVGDGEMKTFLVVSEGGISGFFLLEAQ